MAQDLQQEMQTRQAHVKFFHTCAEAPMKTLMSIILLFLSVSCSSYPWEQQDPTQPKPQGTKLPDMGTIDRTNSRWPQKMVILGDSIATGVLGGTQMGQDFPDAYLKYVVGYMTGGLAGAQLDLKAMGESEKSVYSPFTGSQISGSLGARLASITQGFSYLNTAVPGASSWDITPQLNSAIQAGHNFDFTVMEFGHNDFCNPSGSIDIFSRYYAQHLSRILGINPRARILFVPLLNIPNLYQTAPNSNTATRLAFTFPLAKATCQQMRDEIENACPTFGARASNFGAWSNVVTQTAASFQKLYPEARLVVATDLGKENLVSSEEIAMDCFHPNKAGYQTLATGVWNAIQTSQIFSINSVP